MGGRSWIVRSGRKGWWRLHGQIGEHQLGRSCSSSRRVTTFMGETDSFQPSPDVECKLRVSSSRSSKVQARPSNSASMCYKIVWINCTFHLHVQGNAGSFQPKTKRSTYRSGIANHIMNQFIPWITNLHTLSMSLNQSIWYLLSH